MSLSKIFFNAKKIIDASNIDSCIKEECLKILSPVSNKASVQKNALKDVLNLLDNFFENAELSESSEKEYRELISSIEEIYNSIKRI